MTHIEERRNAYVVYFICVVLTELCIVPVFVLMSFMRPNTKMIACVTVFVIHSCDYVVNYAYLNSGKFTYSLWFSERLYYFQ